ncbi:hypothetical protein KUCAC02_004227 [Chaenocephalus aceratus]|uniref:Uncharacterized protein n=1 Tax=Chaenocephalus aceratus TaxID=36190 RepID=A0ACB9WYL6_CHAAC|nr:hypothetical protein KUCAC02_004227 [Chaenocephalus aceratus]
MKNFNTQYLTVLMKMAVMVYAASLHSTADMLKDIRQEAGKLSNDNKSPTQDTFLCLAEMALARINETELFNKTDKLIRQLLQYNRNHTTSCVLNTTSVEITLKALLDQIKTCEKKS